MRLPTIILALIAVSVFGVDGTVRAGGRYVSVDHPASTVESELQIAVTYTIWIPDGVKTIRGVIVHQHGAGTAASKAGATAAYDLHWQALAKKWDCALLGPSYHVLNEGTQIGPDWGRALGPGIGLQPHSSGKGSPRAHAGFAGTTLRIGRIGDGVYIQYRRNAGAWVLLAVDMVTPYIDNQPLLVANTPETRECRMSFWDSGEANWYWTAAVKVTVGG